MGPKYLGAVPDTLGLQRRSTIKHVSSWIWYHAEFGRSWSNGMSILKESPKLPPEYQPCGRASCASCNKCRLYSGHSAKICHWRSKYKDAIYIGIAKIRSDVLTHRNTPTHGLLRRIDRCWFERSHWNLPKIEFLGCRLSRSFKDFKSSTFRCGTYDFLSSTVPEIIGDICRKKSQIWCI